MEPGQMDSVMQAAERLRRYYESDEDIDTTWPGRPEHVDQLDWMYQRKERDVLTVLSILPKGKRPVPMEFTGGPAGDGEIWYIEQGVVDVHGCACDKCMRNRQPCYPTESDARLALHWQRFDAMAAASR